MKNGTRKKGVFTGTREMTVYSLVGFVFWLFQIVGHDLAAQSAQTVQITQTTGTAIGNLSWTGGYVVRTMTFGVIGGILSGALCCLLGRLLRDRRKSAEVGRTEGEVERTESVQTGNERAKSGRIHLVSFLLLFLCWLPGYLAYYPGICAYDATTQTGQVVSGMFNDHHPIAHTLLIAGAMRLGRDVFGNINTGVGLLILAQMCLAAFVFSWGVRLLYQRGIRRKWLICLQLSGMCYPFHFYMNISLIKDVFFSIFFLVQMLALCEVIRRRKAGPDGFDLLFAAASVGMQLFRNNGRYAMLALLAVLILAVFLDREKRRFWVKLSAGCVIALAAGSLCLSGLFAVTHAEQGDRREMLSMPIQQLARCMLFHGGVGELASDDGTMDEASKAVIDDFLLDEGYRAYRPEISDPVKNHTNTYVARYRAKDFVTTYLRLFRQYPGDFVNAAYAVNAGYFYLKDVSHATVNQNGRDRGLGYVQTRWVAEELAPRGIYPDSKWEWLHERMETWADENGYLKVPVVKYLFVPGVFFWLYLLLAAHLAVRKNYAGWVPLSLVFGYYLTLFLGPVVQLRYLYPLMNALPFMALYLTAKSGAKTRVPAEDRPLNEVAAGVKETENELAKE